MVAPVGSTAIHRDYSNNWPVIPEAVTLLADRATFGQRDLKTETPDEDEYSSSPKIRRGLLMATRDYRLSEFNNGPPPPGQLLQLLAEDHNGTYLLPFPCEWRDGAWRNPKNGKPLEISVVGWRPWRT